jgi:hypothetical protein
MDRFGASVSIYNDIAVVGAPYKTISGGVAKGRVYVFKRTGRVWTQVIGLQASNGLAGDYFGASVKLYGQRLIVGAPNTSHSGKSNAGSAYIFALESGNWVQKKILNAWDPVNQANFGFSVALEGTTAVVGAIYATAGPTVLVGAVYTFSNIDFAGAVWSNGQKLVPETKQAGMRFGYAVDIEGDKIMVGAPSTSSLDGASNAGQAFVYKRENGQWTWASGLNSLVAGENVGMAVAVSGVHNFCSYPGWESGKGKVAVYSAFGNVIFRYDEDREASRSFGQSIAAHDGQFIIGASGGNEKGAIFFGMLD